MSGHVIWYPDRQCHVCGGRYNSWDYKLDAALGYTHATCEACIAKEYDTDIDDLRAQINEFFGLVPCQGI